MSSSYVANPDAQQAGSPAPSPGSYPTAILPADGDAANAASVAELFKVAPDFIAHIQNSVRLDRPVLPLAGSAFTVVSTAGSWTGTLTPSGASSNKGYRFKVKIVTGGAVGVAQFQTSLDGGNSYGGTQTTAASMTDSASGATFTWSGTLTLNSTASFRGAYTPLAQWQNSAGNNRSLVDHNGYPGGRVSVFDEQWGPAFNVNAAGTITSHPTWQIAATSGTVSADSTSLANDSNAAVIGLGTAVKLIPGTTNTNKIALAETEPRFSNALTGISAVMEFEATLSAVGANLITWYFGIAPASDITSSNNGCWFQKASADTTWQCITKNAGTATTINSGVTPVANTYNRFRIEYHGSASPYGATAIFFIDEVLVGVSTTNLPVTGAYGRAFGGLCSGSASSYAAIGPVRLVFNRYLSVPSL